MLKEKSHSRFKRRGADLITEHKLTLDEALTGSTFELEHLCGQKHTLRVESGLVVSPNDLLVAEGLGMPQFREPGKRGDLYIVMSVQIPTQLETHTKTALVEVHFAVLCSRS
jgi:DnaJ family protein A protein 2